jgi:arylsulfatase A-like enzyme
VGGAEEASYTRAVLGTRRGHLAAIGAVAIFLAGLQGCGGCGGGSGGGGKPAQGKAVADHYSTALKCSKKRARQNRRRAERAQAGADAAASEPPNVLVVISDDQRYAGTMGAMPRTRRIFGAGGTTFTDGFVTTPVCCPSRTSILSGLYAHNHGVLTNDNAPGHFDPKRTVLPYLKRDGYRTAIFGKFLNGWDNLRLPPYFDLGYLGFDRQHRDAEDRGLGPNSDQFLWPRVRSFLDGEQRCEDARPWFAVIAARAPHAPFEPPDGYGDLPVGDLVPNPATEAQLEGKNTDLRGDHTRLAHVDDERNPADIRAAQLRQLAGLDDVVGKVFGRIKRQGESGRTLAFYLSDNGFAWGEYGIVDKFLPYDVGVRVPLYARWPGHFRDGEVDRRIAANIDLAPTIFDALGIDPHYPLDGHSLLESERRKALLLEQFSDAPNAPPPFRAIRTPGALYVHYSDRPPFAGRDRPQFSELYELADDPWETLNLLKRGQRHDAPELRRLQRLLARYRDCAGASCP